MTSSMRWTIPLSAFKSLPDRPANLASFRVDLLKKNVAAVKYGLGFRYQKPKSREADNDLLWGQSQSGMIHSPLSTISICI